MKNAEKTKEVVDALVAKLSKEEHRRLFQLFVIPGLELEPIERSARVMIADSILSMNNTLGGFAADRFKGINHLMGENWFLDMCFGVLRATLVFYTNMLNHAVECGLYDPEWQFGLESDGLGELAGLSSDERHFAYLELRDRMLAGPITEDDQALLLRHMIAELRQIHFEKGGDHLSEFENEEDDGPILPVAG